MKSIFILGASRLQVPAIKKAKEKGMYVYALDYDSNAVGISLADKFLEISTIDKEAVYKAALEYEPDYIITSTSDMPVRTVAWVNEKLGKATDISYDGAICATNKVAMRKLMKEKGVPIPSFYEIRSYEEFLNVIPKMEDMFILKPADNAASRGVILVNKNDKPDYEELYLYCEHYSRSGSILVEEFMTGREVSVLSFVDGKTIKTMTSAQDHKRAKDGDQGLNTGGMGTFSPSPFYTKEVDEFCKKYVYQPTVDAMAAEGREFKGIIFFGLMLTADGPKVLEYNARFGDPEAQVVLPRMKNDIVEVMEACIDGTLDQIDLQFEDNAAVCVVLASDGYPVKYEKEIPMYGFENFKDKEGYYCFHAGTKFKDGQIVTNGGRVVGITATGSNLKEARKNAYAATEWITFANKYMRHDIGKAIDEA